MLWEDNYLAHYGVKGQKWGLRRFQNEDGSYTNEGLARLNQGVERARAMGQTVSNHFQQARARVKAIRKSSNKTQALAQRSKPKQTTEQQKQRTKKIIAAAGAVTLAAVAGYALHKRHKTNAILANASKQGFTFKNRKEATKYAKVVKNKAKKAKALLKEKQKVSISNMNVNKAQTNLEAMKRLQEKQNKSMQKAMKAFDQADAIARKFKK